MLAPDDRLEAQLLRDQLARMRGMLGHYSDLFFRRIRDWAIVTVALLVLGSTEAFPAAIVFVPFLVPFAFLETAYLFFYTVLARRYAERLDAASTRWPGRTSSSPIVSRRPTSTHPMRRRSPRSPRATRSGWSRS
jgi:hypothetical protein